MRSKENYVILISTSIFTFVIAGSRPLIPLYSTELGASLVEVGLITSLFSLLSLFLAIPLGRSIDKIDVKIPLYLCLFLSSFSLIIPFMADNIVGVCISQVLAGVAQMVFVISMQSYAGSMKGKKTQEQYIAIFSIGVAIGSFAGPLVSGFLSQTLNYPIAMFYLGIIVLFASPFISLLKGGSKKQEDNKSVNQSKNSFDLLKNGDLRKAILISALLLLGKDIYIAFFPLLAQSKGISTSMIGIIISANAAAGIFIRLITPFLLRYFQSSMIMMVSLIVAGCSYFLNPLVSSLPMLIFVSIALGIGLGVGQPLSILKTINSLPENRLGEGLGLRLSVNKFTQVIAPVFLGGFSGLYGIVSVFYITGVIMFLGTVNIKSTIKFPYKK